MLTTPKIELKFNTPINIAVDAIRTCYDSFDKATPEKDRVLVDNIIKSGHTSTIEHLVYHFFISDISRALLQEFARHRIASLSVKSTRYTLKELENESEFTAQDFTRAGKYLVFTGIDAVDVCSIQALENLRKLVVAKDVDGKRLYPNDKAKFALPDSYKTQLSWTINARSLRNFLELRSSERALWEIQNLANAIFNTLPDDHKFIFEDVMHK